MKFSIIISCLKQAERKTIIFFVLFSVIFHFFLAYWFYTAKFTIQKIKPQNIIVEIRPLPHEKTIFPTIPGSRINRGAFKPGTSAKTSASPTASSSQNTPSPGGIFPGGYVGGSESPGKEPGPGGIPNNGKKTISAPFNPSRYLKPENLAEILRRIEQEKMRPVIPSSSAITSTIGGTSTAGEPGAEVGANSDIVIDAEGQAYFDSKGFDLTLWARKVTARILENWFIPAELMPGNEANGVVGIAAVIKKNGMIITQKIQRPSDMQLLDQAALNAFIISSPFPPLPSAYTDETLNVYFLFNYHFPISKPVQTAPKESSLLKIQKDSLITSLGLVKGNLLDGSVPPKFLVLGIEVKQNTYYRLMSEDQSIASGLLQEGPNFIEIPASGMFQRSRTYNYILYSKPANPERNGNVGNVIDIVSADNIPKISNGEQTLAFSLNIVSNLSVNSGQVREEIRKTGYGLALFVQNRLIAFHKKSVQYRNLFPQDRSRKEQELNYMGRRPDNPLQFIGEHHPQATMPILPMALMAGKFLLKKAHDKKKEEAAKMKLNIVDRLSGTFLIKDSDGVDKPLDVMVAFQLNQLK